MIRPSCGSESGYSLHRRNHEPACLACLKAHSLYNGRRHIPGTAQGITSHRKHSSPVCDPCLTYACISEFQAARRYFHTLLKQAS